MDHCRNVSRLNHILHALINVFSTALLAVSNYAMQISLAPTRQDIDYAHSKRRWLDIGAPSVSNLLYISGTRRILFILLFLSSIPLHLFYNSIIFASSSEREYSALLVDESFFASTGAYNTYNRNISDPFRTVFGYSPAPYSMVYFFPTFDTQDQWTNISKAQCSKMYRSRYLSNHGGVTLVADKQDSSVNFSRGYITTYIYGTTSVQPAHDLSLIPEDTPWYCNDSVGYCDADNNLDILTAQVMFHDKLEQHNFTINYCLAQKEYNQGCHIDFSPIMMIIVIISNTVKVICLVIIARKFRVNYPALLTTGDAVQSFLERPDDTVKGLCVAKASDFSEYQSYLEKLLARGIPARQIIAPQSSKIETISWSNERYDLLYGTEMSNIVLDSRIQIRRWFNGGRGTQWYIQPYVKFLAMISSCSTNPLA